MKVAMLIQPMNGLTDEEILYIKTRAIKLLEEKGYFVLDTFFLEPPIDSYKNKGVYYLAKSLDSMSICDAVYCCKGWEKYRGCKIEHDVALNYGIEIMYEE